MKIVFLSNFFNHHQQPFSDAMEKLTNGQYYFVETEKMDAERIRLGYTMSNIPSYVLRLEKDEDEIKNIINDADAVIIGSAPNDLIVDRLKQ